MTVTSSSAQWSRSWAQYDPQIAKETVEVGRSIPIERIPERVGARCCGLRHGVPPEDVSTSTVGVEQPKMVILSHEKPVCVSLNL